jgi:hypothetical protein
MKKVMFLYRPDETYKEFLPLIERILKAGYFSTLTIGKISASDNCTAGGTAWRQFKSSKADILIVGEYIYLEEEYPHLVFTSRTDSNEFFDRLCIAAM